MNSATKPTDLLNPARNIICFEIEDSSWEQIYLHAIVNDIGNYSLDKIENEWWETRFEKNIENAIFYKMLYVEDRDIINYSEVNKSKRYDNENNSSSENESENLKLDSQTIEAMIEDYYLFNHAISMGKYLEKIKPTRDYNFENALDEKSIMKWIEENKTFYLKKEDFDKLKQINNQIVFSEGYFFERGIHINVNGLTNLTASIIEKDYNISLVFNELIGDICRKINKLTSIYYKDGMPIAFVFKKEQCKKEYFAYNRDFLKAINEITPINQVPISKEDVLKIVSDKINKIGLNRVSSFQKNFFWNNFGNEKLQKIFELYFKIS